MCIRDSDNVGVVLTGLFTVSNNQKTAINSPRLKFNTETFGFEEELEEIAADIETEVYAFPVSYTHLYCGEIIPGDYPGVMECGRNVNNALWTVRFTE